MTNETEIFEQVAVKKKKQQPKKNLHVVTVHVS